VNKYSIRFNKFRGQEGRGSYLHVWRVFENGREILAKYVKINVKSWTELDENGQDYNIACYGRMTFFDDTETVVINE
jgi:hypothetical protein